MQYWHTQENQSLACTTHADHRVINEPLMRQIVRQKYHVYDIQRDARVMKSRTTYTNWNMNPMVTEPDYQAYS